MYIPTPKGVNRCCVIILRPNVTNLPLCVPFMATRRHVYNALLSCGVSQKFVDVDLVVWMRRFVLYGSQRRL